MSFFNFSDNWGGFTNPISYLIDNVKGTFVQRPEDKSYYSPAFNTAINANGGVGGIAYGPVFVSPGTTAPKTALTNNATLNKSVITPVAKSVASALLPNNDLMTFGLIAVSAMVFIKILK